MSRASISSNRSDTRFSPADVGARFLHPGDVASGKRGDRFETLLGSCVSIILTDPPRTVGAMCHIVHVIGGTSVACTDTTHAEPAMASMFRHLRSLGIEPRLCEAYVYGGGNMFPSQVTVRRVGDRNAEWALAALEDQGVHVVAQDVGGQGYRRLGWTVGHDAPQVATISVRPGI